MEHNKIKLKNRIEVDQDRYSVPNPDTFHLRNNKLWFTRDKRHTPPALPPAIRHLYRSPSPTSHYIHISYFDLDVANPKEVQVDFIKEVGKLCFKYELAF
jgi:hypothetical protein